MRAVVALALSAVLLAAAASPHVHRGVQGDHDCPACLARTIEAARPETPDLAPRPVRFPGVVFLSVESVPVGAPLGAIPGQSPPVNA